MIIRIACLAALLLVPLRSQAQIKGETKDVKVDFIKMEGTASISVPHITWSIHDKDNPDCASTDFLVGGVPLPNNEAHCRRLCGHIPEPYTLDPKRPTTGVTSRSGWTAVFNAEWFRDTNTACIHFKNWRTDADITGTIHVPVKHR